MEKTILCLAMVLMTVLSAYCGQLSTIELNDGSMIEAEVVSLGQGIYTLKSVALGEIRVEASKVRSIVEKTGPAAPQLTGLSPAGTALLSTDAMKSQADMIESNMAKDPGIMKIVAELMFDPQFQEVMKDPQIAEAAKARDIQALLNNPKFLGLMNHQQIQEIQNKMTGEQ